MVGLQARTARERLTLHRILLACPAAEEAFLAGRLSRCQVLALGRVLRTPGVDAQAWIAEAEGMSVRAIRQKVRAWSADQPHEAEHEGTEVGFEIPATMLLAWEQGLEGARRALGESAPVWRCMEAVLAETGFAGVGDGEAGENAESEKAEKAEAQESEGAPCDPAVPPTGPSHVEPTRVRVPASLARRVRRDLAVFEQHQRDVRDLLDAEAPRDAFDALSRLQSIERLRAPWKILLSRLVRDLHDLRAAPALGSPTLADLLVAELRISERTARRLLEIATAFEDAPILEREVGSGSLSLGKALLARRLGGGKRLALHIARARALTHRAFEQEAGFLWLLRRCVPEIGRRFPGPLPQPGLEEALISEIRLWSLRPERPKAAPPHGEGSKRDAPRAGPATSEEVLQELDRRFGALDPQASIDPAENPIVLERLKALLEKLVLLVWEDGEPLERPMSATLGRTVRVRFWAPWPVAADFRAAIRWIREHARGPGPPEIFSKALAPPPAGSPVQAKGMPWFSSCASRPSALQMAEWQAAIVLLGSAARIWEAQRDPNAARTLRGRILTRDRRRCVAPGCTRRRMLEVHHGVFRSRGGRSTASNLMTLCHGHHRHVLHQGCARQRGIAPQSLTWELGCRPGRPPLRRMRGERAVASGSVETPPREGRAHRPTERNTAPVPPHDPAPGQR